MVCEECKGVDVSIVDAVVIYPHRRDLKGKSIWRCVCGAFVGCHPGTTSPLGTPAGPDLRRMRNLTHAMFDRLWRGGNAQMKRGEAYAWLSRSLEIPQERTHIGMFDVATCRRAINLVNEKRQ